MTVKKKVKDPMLPVLARFILQYCALSLADRNGRQQAELQITH